MDKFLEKLDKFPEGKTSFLDLEMQLQESEDMTPEQKKEFGI